MKPKTLKPKTTIAAKSRSFEAAFPRHPSHDRLIANAMAKRADELRSEEGQLSAEDAIERADREYEGAIQAVIFPPPDDAFYFIWRNVPSAANLAQHIRAAWEAAPPGTYGSNPPRNYIAKL